MLQSISAVFMVSQGFVESGAARRSARKLIIRLSSTRSIKNSKTTIKHFTKVWEVEIRSGWSPKKSSCKRGIRSKEFLLKIYRCSSNRPEDAGRSSRLHSTTFWQISPTGTSSNTYREIWVHPRTWPCSLWMRIKIMIIRIRHQRSTSMSYPVKWLYS